MRKGQKVRILKTDEIGIIADSTFFVLNGRKHIRYEIRKKNEVEGRWYSASDLGNVVSVNYITFKGENNQEILVKVSINFINNKIHFELKGNNLYNLKEQDGNHVRLLFKFLESFQTDPTL